MILFQLLFNFCYCTIVGIDLGSDSIKVAVGSRFVPVHLVKNLFSNEVTPNIFAFRDQSNWAFGESAQYMCRLHPESCIQRLPFDNNFYFKTFQLKGYQIASLALCQILQNVKNIEKINDDIKVIIAIPPSMSNREKSYLYSALSVSQINCIQFVTSTYAPIELYVKEKRYESPYFRTAVFIDIGHSGIRLSGFEFNDTRIDQTFSEYKDKVGGQTIDENLLNIVINRYNLYLSDPDIVNLLTQIRKAREQLTVNSKITFDFRFKEITLTRQDIIDSCSEIKETLNKMISSLKKTHQNLLSSGSIQLLGGCSRIPCLQDYIKKLLPKCKQLKTMDCISSVCRGACYIANGEIPSQIQVSNALVTTEVTLETAGSVYKIFSYTNNENFNPVIRLNSVQPNQLFKIADNGQEFSTFSIVLPNNYNYYNSYSNAIDVGFTLNYFLMPVPDQPLMIQRNNQVPLTINYQKVGWEIDSDELERSIALIKSMESALNKQSNPIQNYKEIVENKIQKFGVSNWRSSVFAGICRFVDSKYEIYKANDDSAKIDLLLQDFKQLVKYTLDIGDDVNNDNGNFNSYDNYNNHGSKAERNNAIEELHSLIEACKALKAKYADADEWIKQKGKTASLNEIKNWIQILNDRGQRAQLGDYL